MLRAGNQVLFRTVEGYLRRSFHVVLILPETTDPQAADPPEIFPSFEGRVEVVRVRPFGAAILRRAKELVKRDPGRMNPTLGASGFPSPQAVLPFHDGARFLALLPLASFGLSAYQVGARLIRQRRIDLIAGFEVMANPAASLLGRRFGIPSVGHFQGTFLCTMIGQGKAAYIRQIADFVGTAAPLDLYFMLNDGTRGEQVLRELGVPADRVRFRISGVRRDIYRPEFDAATFLRSRYGIDTGAGARVLLSMSKLTRWKRVERAILAMPEILKSQPDTYLLIAHRGPLRERLANLASTLGLQDRVRFLGAIPHEDIAGLLNSCDVFLSVNDHSNLSNPLLEALECGCAILTLDDGSTAGVLRDRENALLVPLSELPGGLAVAALSLLGDRTLLQRLREGARATAERKLRSWEERIEEEMNDVDDLLEGQPHARGASRTTTMANRYSH